MVKRTHMNLETHLNDIKIVIKGIQTKTLYTIMNFVCVCVCVCSFKKFVPTARENDWSCNKILFNV